MDTVYIRCVVVDNGPGYAHTRWLQNAQRELEISCVSVCVNNNNNSNTNEQMLFYLRQSSYNCKVTLVSCKMSAVTQNV